MVKIFNQRKKKIYSESLTDREHQSPKDQSQKDKNQSINSQISFFNDLSSIKEASSFNSIDSGYDSVNFRHRSTSCDTRSMQTSVIDAYAKYPNWKWSHLKYFGEDPKEYLSRFNIDLDTINEISTITHTIAGGNRGDNGIENKETFASMRRRSQSVNVKSVAKATNIQGGQHPKNENKRNFSQLVDSTVGT